MSEDMQAGMLSCIQSTNVEYKANNAKYLETMSQHPRARVQFHLEQITILHHLSPYMVIYEENRIPILVPVNSIMVAVKTQRMSYV